MKSLSMKITDYLKYLKEQEKSASTRRQYHKDILNFLDYFGTTPASKDLVINYKEILQLSYRPASVNTKLAAINGFLEFAGRPELKVRLLKIQHRPYCPGDRMLTKAEYLRLVKASESRKNERLSLLLQTLCSTGIRVSELAFITAEAVKTGEAVVRLKGKTRIVLIPGKMKRKLSLYIKKQEIQSGTVFLTRGGRPLDRSNIWKMMKSLCTDAHVDPEKVFPHNLRHLFARCFYSIDKDLAKLADILGHSDINTTRIYIISTGKEHLRRLDTLDLVV